MSTATFPRFATLSEAPEAQPPPHFEDIKNSPEFQGASDLEKRSTFFTWQRDHYRYMQATGAGLDEKQARTEQAYFDRQLKELDLKQDTADSLMSFGGDVFEGMQRWNLPKIALEKAGQAGGQALLNRSQSDNAGMGTRAMLGAAQGIISTTQAVDVFQTKAAETFHAILGQGRSETVDRLREGIVFDVLAKRNIAILGDKIGGGFAGDIIQAGGGAAVQLVPQVLIGTSATLLSGGNPKAGLAASAIFAGASTYSDTYGTAMEMGMANGKDADTAAKDAMLPAVLSSIITGGVTLAFGNTGVEKVWAQGGAGAVRSKLFEFFRQGALEGLEELTDSILNSVNQKMTFNKGLTFTDALKDATMSALLGFGIGGTINLIVPKHAHSQQSEEPAGVSALATPNPEPGTVPQAAPEPPKMPQDVLGGMDTAAATPDGKGGTKLPETVPFNPDIETTDAPDLGEFEARQFSARSMELETTLEASPEYEESGVSSREIIGDLQTLLKKEGNPTPIRIGRGMFTQRKAVGFYDVRREVIRMETANNIPTATHEVGHALEKMVFAEAGADLTPEVKAELHKLGTDLYGARKPANGYVSEGFAEFARLYLTTDDVASVAPNAAKFFEEKVFSKRPELAKGLNDIKEKVTAYRNQGAANRAKANMEALPGRLEQVKQGITKAIETMPQSMVDEFAPLLKLSNAVEERTGQALAPVDDPYEVASWLRGNASARLNHMVYGDMIDFAGNKVGVSLVDALAVIEPKESSDFASYLWARRAVERWGKGMNPGMSKEDATFLVQSLGNDRFELAASKVYEWNNGILEYVKQAAPQMAPVIEKIQAQSHDYVPLARVFDASETTETAKILAGGGASNPLKSFQGSGRNVRDIIPTMIQNAEKLMRQAHKSRVLDTLVRLEGKPGVGYMIEEVPRNMIPNKVAWEQLQGPELNALRKHLSDAGIDVDSKMQDAVMTFFAPETRTNGNEPIIPVMKDGKLKFYYVDPALHEALSGVDLYRLPKALDLFFGMPARLFRLGTTGLRPAFNLITNPLRDIQTFMFQSSSSNPKDLAVSYFRALQAQVIPLTAEDRAFKDAFVRLGASLAQPLGTDTAITRKVGRDVFKGKVLRTVTDPLNAVREILSIPEAAPRIAEMRLVAGEIGWDGKSPLTINQAVRLANAAKRVTVDFSAAGRWGKKINQAVPFFNASVQGTRLFAKNMVERPARTVLGGLVSMTIPTLALWWQNKDEEWYKDMPDKEKFLFWYVPVPGTDTILRIPRTFDYGALFASVPEALFNAWHQQDPAEVASVLGQWFDSVVPLDLPVPLRAAKEQLQNKVDFFDTPIVPRSQMDMMPGDQRGPYTSGLANYLGDLFPNAASPRRIDAAIRAFAGGLGPDVLSLLGLGTVSQSREMEASDIPVLGNLFKRGGVVNQRSESQENLYKAYSEAVQIQRSPRIKETEEQRQRRLMLKDAIDAVQILSEVENATYGMAERAELRRKTMEIAKAALAATDIQDAAQVRASAKIVKAGKPKE